MPGSVELFYTPTEQVELKISCKNGSIHIRSLNAQKYPNIKKTFGIFSKTLSTHLLNNFSYKAISQEKSIVIQNPKERDSNTFKNDISTLLFDSFKTDSAKSIEAVIAIPNDDSKFDDCLTPKEEFLKSDLMQCLFSVTGKKMPVTLTDEGDFITIAFQAGQSKSRDTLRNRLETHPKNQRKATKKNPLIVKCYTAKPPDSEDSLSIIISPLPKKKKKFRITVCYVLLSLEGTLSSQNGSSLHSCLAQLLQIDDDTTVDDGTEFVTPNEEIREKNPGVFLKPDANMGDIKEAWARKYPKSEAGSRVKSRQANKTGGWTREHRHLILFTSAFVIITAVAWALREMKETKETKVAEFLSDETISWILIAITALTAASFAWTVISYCFPRKESLDDIDDGMKDVEPIGKKITLEEKINALIEGCTDPVDNDIIELLKNVNSESRIIAVLVAIDLLNKTGGSDSFKEALTELTEFYFRDHFQKYQDHEKYGRLPTLNKFEKPFPSTKEDHYQNKEYSKTSLGSEYSKQLLKDFRNVAIVVKSISNSRTNSDESEKEENPSKNSNTHSPTGSSSSTGSSSPTESSSENSMQNALANTSNSRTNSDESEKEENPSKNSNTHSPTGSSSSTGSSSPAGSSSEDMLEKSLAKIKKILRDLAEEDPFEKFLAKTKEVLMKMKDYDPSSDTNSSSGFIQRGNSFENMTNPMETGDEKTVSEQENTEQNYTEIPPPLQSIIEEMKFLTLKIIFDIVKQKNEIIHRQANDLIAIQKKVFSESKMFERMQQTLKDLRWNTKHALQSVGNIKQKNKDSIQSAEFLSHAIGEHIEREEQTVTEIKKRLSDLPSPLQASRTSVTETGLSNCLEVPESSANLDGADEKTNVIDGLNRPPLSAASSSPTQASGPSKSNSSTLSRLSANSGASAPTTTGSRINVRISDRGIPILTGSANPSTLFGNSSGLDEKTDVTEEQLKDLLDDYQKKKQNNTLLTTKEMGSLLMLCHFTLKKDILLDERLAAISDPIRIHPMMNEPATLFNQRINNSGKTISSSVQTPFLTSTTWKHIIGSLSKNKDEAMKLFSGNQNNKARGIWNRCRACMKKPNEIGEDTSAKLARWFSAECQPATSASVSQSTASASASP